MVLQTAARVLGDAEAAQDVHQEVFLAIWQRWAKLDRRVSWPGYLYRTTVHKAIESIRRKKKWPDSLEDRDPAPRRHDEPSDHLAAQECQEKLRLCVGRLPEKQAQVFVLSRFEGLGHAEIAEFLHCSQETVRVHLHRALRSLTESMREFREGRGT